MLVARKGLRKERKAGEGCEGMLEGGGRRDVRRPGMSDILEI